MWDHINNPYGWYYPYEDGDRNDNMNPFPDDEGERGWSEPIDGQKPAPNEVVIYLKTEEYKAPLRKVVTGPGDAINVEWARIGGPQQS